MTQEHLATEQHTPRHKQTNKEYRTTDKATTLQMRIKNRGMARGEHIKMVSEL